VWQSVSRSWRGGAGHTYLVDLLEPGALGAVVLEDVLSQLLQTSQLVLSLADDPLKGAQLSLGGTLVEQVDVDVLGEGELALVDGLEERRLTAAVLTEKAVAAAVGDFERGVVEELLAVEHQRRRCDLDIARRGQRREHTRGDAVGETVLVLLHGELLDLFVELEVLAIVAVDRRCGRVGLGVGLGRQLRGRRLLGLEGAGLSLLGVAGSFGCGDHSAGGGDVEGGEVVQERARCLCLGKV
jgi:hypothetical protein